MSNCDIDDDDLKDLVAQPWDNLESIWMSYNAFTAKGIEYISAHPWPSLVSLHMSTEMINKGGNLLYDQGVLNLLKGNWSKLKKLYLSFCHISDEGIFQICKY